MNKYVMKRFAAYLIDLLILGCIIGLVSWLLPENNNVAVLNLEMNRIHELAIGHEISITGYLNQFASIMHDLDIEKILFNILNAVFILGYFVMLPYFFQGQTFGCKLFHLQIVRDDKKLLTMNDLLYRNTITTGLAFLMGSLALVYIVPSLAYFILVTILGTVQLTLVIISLFMILYRHDKLGLQDVFTHTRVIELDKLEVEK